MLGDEPSGTTARDRPRRVVLVSPVYLDVPSFSQLRDRAIEAFARDSELSDTTLEFVTLDDTAGRDPEIDRLREFEDVRVISPPYNLGHQRGLVFAVRKVSAELGDSDIVVTLDGDGEDKPEDVPRLVRSVIETEPRESAIVLAKRTGRPHTPFAFRALYLGFKALFRLATGSTVQSGNFAAYYGWTAKRLLIHPAFALCYSSALLTMSTPIVFVPCERGARFEGKSRMGYSRLFNHAMRMMMPFSDRIARRALWLFLLTLIVAVILALVVIGIRLFTDAAVPGWATYALGATGILSLIALGDLVVLFTVFSQSTSITLTDLEEQWDG